MSLKIDKFKEQVIFELEKDKPLEAYRIFRSKCIKKYDYNPSTELITRINNYQVKKYGRPINKTRSINYIKNIGNYTPHERHLKNMNTNDYSKLKGFQRRNEKNEK